MHGCTLVDRCQLQALFEGCKNNEDYSERATRLSKDGTMAIARDICCNYICPESEKCQLKSEINNQEIKLGIEDTQIRGIIENFLKKGGVDGAKIKNFVEVLFPVVKKHIGLHMYYLLTNDCEWAIWDFMRRFAWMLAKLENARRTMEQEVRVA